MTLYLDTSALLKLWVPESGHQEVRALESQATEIGTSTVAVAEAHAAVGRWRREGTIAPADLDRMSGEMVVYWRSIRRVVAGPSISIQAGALAQRHALRGFDAIHLASALHIQRMVGPVRFLCFDKRLNDGARTEGLQLLA